MSDIINNVVNTVGALVSGLASLQPMALNWIVDPGYIPKDSPNYQGVNYFGLPLQILLIIATILVFFNVTNWSFKLWIGFLIAQFILIAGLTKVNNILENRGVGGNKAMNNVLFFPLMTSYLAWIPIVGTILYFLSGKKDINPIHIVIITLAMILYVLSIVIESISEESGGKISFNLPRGTSKWITVISIIYLAGLLFL